MSKIYESNQKLIELNKKLSEIDQNIGAVDRILKRVSDEVDNLDTNTSVKGPSALELKEELDRIYDIQDTDEIAKEVEETTALSNFKYNNRSIDSIKKEVLDPDNINRIRTGMSELHTPSTLSNSGTTFLDENEKFINAENDINKPSRAIWNTKSSLNYPNMKNGIAVGIKTQPSLSRTIFLNMFSSLDSVEMMDEDHKEFHIPYSKHYNTVEEASKLGKHKLIAIEIDRTFSVQSYDFGINYLTKEKSISNNNLNDDTQKSNSGYISNAYVKRFYGSFILTGCKAGETLDIKSIVYNSEKDIQDSSKFIKNGLSPEFSFKFSVDETANKIYIWLEKVKPYRMLWFDLAGLSSTETGNITYTQVLREISELNSPHKENLSSRIDNNILPWLKDNKGQKAISNLLGASDGDIKDVLDIIGSSNVDNTGDETFLVPHYDIYFSLKDNSFKPKGTFVTKVVSDIETVKALPGVNLDIIPDSTSMVQLNGIGLSRASELRPKTIKYDISNSIVDPLTGEMVTDKEPSEVIELVKQILIDNMEENKKLTYHLKVSLSTEVDLVSKTINSSIPDYIIDEMGFVNKSGADYKYSYDARVMKPRFMGYEGPVSTNQDMQRILYATYGYKHFTGYDINGDVNMVTSATRLPLHISGISEDNPLGIFTKKDVIPTELDADNYSEGNRFKGYFKVTLEIYNMESDLRKIDIECLSINDPYVSTHSSDSSGVEFEGVVTGSIVIN